MVPPAASSVRPVAAADWRVTAPVPWLRFDGLRLVRLAPEMAGRAPVSCPAGRLVRPEPLPVMVPVPALMLPEVRVMPVIPERAPALMLRPLMLLLVGAVMLAVVVRAPFWSK